MIISPAETAREIELSVVIPCLNEAETLASCLEKAQVGVRRAGCRSEIIVADNGSTDGSAEIAAAMGARVVHAISRGYGSALRDGFAAARGKYLLMGDADSSYDFREIPQFVQKLREGYELVQGCRLPSGGGSVMPGAMPFLHRWLGNPMFSWMARTWFKAPIHDVHSGMRAFTKDLYERLHQRCTGMEFASENVVKAGLLRARIAEVPITLHRDGRTAHPPHLRTFRDGWRHLRFYLLYSPRWLFLIPGILLGSLGLLGIAVAMPGLTVRGVRFDVHTLLVSFLLVFLGAQAVGFAVMTKVYAASAGLLPPNARLAAWSRHLTLERALAIGAALVLTGTALVAAAVLQWYQAGFRDLDSTVTMRWLIPGVSLVMLGAQTIFGAFFVSVLALPRR
ncbi:MAG: glycosyltransferase family 2 protein [Gemmatimonadaceae bacterium]